MSNFKRVIKNTGYLFASRILSRVIYTVFVLYAAAKLGPELFGAFAFAYAVAELLSWIGGLGLSRYGAREIVRYPEDKAGLIGEMFVLQMVSVFIICLVMLIGLLAWYPPYPKMQLILLGLVAVMLSGFVNVSESAFMATERFIYSAVFTFTGRLIFVAIGFGFIAAGASVLYIMWGFIIGMAVESALRFYVITTKLTGFKLRFSLAGIVSLFIATFPFAVVAVASVIFSRIAVVILEMLKDDAAVGIYALAYSFFMPFVWFSLTVTRTLFPGFAELYKKDKELARINSWQWYRFLLLAVIPMAIVMSMLSRLGLSYFSSGYEQSIIVLQILFASMPFVLIGSYQFNILQIIDREGTAARISMFAAIITVVFGFIFIYLFGVVGAAISNLAGAIVREILIYYQVYVYFLRKHMVTLYIRPMLAGAAMLAVGLLTWNINRWLSVSLAAVVYLVVIFMIKGVRYSELKAVMRS